MLRILVLPLVLAATQASAAGSPKPAACKGVPLQERGQTLVWEGRYTGSGPVLLALHDGPKGSVLSAPVSRAQASALQIGPGGIGVVTLENGVTLRREVPTTTRGEILLESVGTIWRFDIPISDDDLKALSLSPIVSTQLLAGTLTFDDRFLGKPQAPKLQRAAGCILALAGRDGREPHKLEAPPEPVTPPPTPATPTPKPDEDADLPERTEPEATPAGDAPFLESED